MRHWGLRNLIILGGLAASAFTIGQEDREVLFRHPVTHLVKANLEGVSPTDKIKFRLSVDRFFLTRGESRRFTFDQKVFIHQVILHVESNGPGPSAFGVVTNGHPSLEYKVPPCDPEYHVDVDQKAWGFTVASTGTSSQWDGRLQVNFVEVEVSPLAIYQTLPNKPERLIEKIIEREAEGERVQIKFPDYRWTPMWELSESVENSCNALKGHFNLRQQGCFVYRVKKASILAKAQAKGLGDANINAAPGFRRLLEELDCAAPLFDDGIERDFAAGDVGDIVQIRETIRHNLGYPNNTCPIKRLKELVKSRCADAEYIDSLLAKYEQDAEWMRQWSDDTRREREARKLLLETLKAKLEVEQTALENDIDDSDDIKVEVTIPNNKKKSVKVEKILPPQTKSLATPANVTPSTNSGNPVAGLPQPRPAS
jgi:hypothetical protein